ncbi:glycosyltransferase family 2 protein [Calothrix sp. 336/3]|uniref:glycosyltransferase family 2 protein n=1 Tax=Calothrix sp. 336/3 TaxID=1337936 RepID=UPI0004E454E2|nr:glycosyltransferase family 2 protein [Calothrix sp. 336/3]AKG23267.1 glycosyl transferase [Calothrix sp. 336/3]
MPNHNSTPLVSVITPTYNRPEYLQIALRSAIQQTYQNIEIIVSDNCSEQNPQEIINSFADSRIRFFRNTQNLGMFQNTMGAAQKAQGKYIAFLLDDDVWEPDFLAKLVPNLEANPDLALAFCDHYVINGDGSINYTLTEEYSQAFHRANLSEGIYQPFIKQALVDGAVSSATASVIRRDVVEWSKIPAEVGGSWDIFINYLCCHSGLGAYFVPEKLTNYREHENTDTQQSGKSNYQSKIKKAEADLFCYQQLLKDTNLREFHDFFQQKKNHISTTLGIGLMRAKKPEVARPYFWRSLREKFSLRTLVALILSFFPPSLASRF